VSRNRSGKNERESQQVKGNGKTLIQPLKFLRRKSANEVGESGLRKAYQFIAMDAAFVFHALFDPNWELRGKLVVRAVDRGTHDG
jgi:hypothetical protein